MSKERSKRWSKRRKKKYLKSNDIPNLIGLSKDRVEAILTNKIISYQFVELKNHKHQYKEKRVVRQSIRKTDDGELLVVEFTGFPTLDESADM